MLHHPIFTAGYGNLGFQRYIELLESNRITHIVDIRSIPYSTYWTEFRRENLEAMVPAVGMKYVYMGDTLGASQACAPESDKLAKKRYEIGQRKLIDAASSDERVICLMCGCAKPEACHRSTPLGDNLVSKGAQILHLMADGRVINQIQILKPKYVTQDALFE